MVRALASFACALAVLLVADGARAGPRRDLLWRVVQTCMANHLLTGGSFPCLEVDMEDGRDSGYVVLRAPFAESHIVVSPTVRTVGIEAERLRGDAAPNYFRDAWEARHYATEGLPVPVDRGDLALAVNSRPGRSQDQLHIHVDCIRPDAKQSLLRQASNVHVKRWTRIKVLPHAPPYWALALSSDDLSGLNLFDTVAKGLDIDPDNMDDTTIVVAGADDIHGKPGFIVLARQRVPDGNDEAHGEALLDHSCRAFH